MKKILTVLGVILIIGVYAYEHYLNTLPLITEESVLGNTIESHRFNELYIPQSTTQAVVTHNYYALSYNETYEQAEWVIYTLKKSDVVSTDRKRPFFIQDPAVTSESADWRNYKNSGFDKGHLCPAGDRKFNKEAYNETFLTSNIAPQNHDFNAGIWNELEQQVRRWAKQYNRVFVITGGVLNAQLRTIGKENVAVPKYFYKIVGKETKGQLQIIAFLMPNSDKTNASVKDYVVSVDRLEQLTGIDFFPKLEDGMEEELESNVDVGHWRFR